MNDNDQNLIGLTADLIGAYVSNNSVPVASLPTLIADVYSAFASVGSPSPEPTVTPAVNPKKSVFPDYLVSLEDGKHYRTLRRHLAGRGLTPEEYRAKWNLASNYPMVAPNYSATRSALAKTLGLGKRKAAPPSPPEPVKAKRGRPAKAAAE